MNLFSLPTALNDFFLIFLSILVEGIPFILIGAILASIVEVFVSENRLLRLLPKRNFTKHLGMTLLGNLMPVCECGNIPLAKRMILKKIPINLAITFLLAAPVFNPIVIASTLAAFPGNYSILLLRLLFTAIIAIGAGYLFMSFKPKALLSAKMQDEQNDQETAQDHGDHNHNTQKSPGRISQLTALIKKDFIEMTAIFVFGALIATLIQVLLPKDFILSFNQLEWIAILAMMLMAFIISICANVDAFFALAYAQVFPMSSILAFLVLGPMIDIKAIPMLRSIFSWQAIIILCSFVTLATFGLTYGYFLIS